MTRDLHSALAQVAVESGTAGIKKLCDTISRDARFTNIDPKALVEELRNLSESGRGVITDVTVAADKLFKLLSPNAEWIPPSPKSADVLVNPVKRHLGTATSWASRTAEQWKGLTGGERTMTGLGLLTAALSTVAAFSHASKAIEKDAEGNRHLKPSMVGMALLDTAFAVGLTYLSILTLRSGAAR